MAEAKKEYENKSVNITIKMADSETQVDKRAGGTYPGAEIIYTGGGTTENKTKGIHEKSFQWKPELKVAIDKMKKGDKYTMNMYREVDTPFWNVDSFVEGHQDAPKQSNNSFSGKKDFSGVETGHAINAARNLLTPAKALDRGILIKAACALHDLTASLKEETATANPKMSQYDVGASVGHAVLNACSDAKKMADVEAIAREMLSDVAPTVLAYILSTKGDSKPAEEAIKEKAPTKEEPAAEPEEDDDDDVF